MSDGQVSAWHFKSCEPVTMSWRGGKITAIEPAKIDPPRNTWLAPSLVELQVNGYGGIAYHKDDITAEELLRSVSRLARDGCGHVLITLTTRPWGDLMAQLRRVKKLREETPALKAAIAGWHIEGPFMSPEPGFVGAHKPDWMVSPTPENIHELREITQGDPVLLTVAPERPGVLDAVKLATSLGIVISLGHTNAPKDVIDAAIAAGAQAFTHLGNGMPQAIDRHDNILWRVFDSPALTSGLIPDTIHVSPTLFRAIHRARDPKKIYYTTDAVSPAGMPPGRYTLGISNKREFDVGPDQVVREPGKTNFAGSAARPMEVLFRAAQMLGCTWQEAWERYSTQPARLMNIDAGLTPGRPASFCILEMPEPLNGTYSSYILGEKVATLPARPRMEGAGIEA
jgi:N-acetylglucosamine-6-phosphate deacetylase